MLVVSPTLMTASRSPPSTCCTVLMASLVTVPARGAVIAASIFFHGFDGRDGLGCNDRVTLGDGESDDSGERGGNMRWVAAVCFLRRGCLRGDGAVSHRHRA
jgi:hypothetical protein